MFFSNVEAQESKEKYPSFLRPRLGTSIPSLPPHTFGQSKTHGQIQSQDGEKCNPHIIRGHYKLKVKGDVHI